MTTTPTRPAWWTDHHDAAADLARRAATQGTWPTEYKPPTDPTTEPLVGALATLAGHALTRLDIIDKPTDRTAEAELGYLLTAVALAEATTTGDTTAAEHLLPTDIEGLRQVALDSALLLAQLVTTVYPGHEQETYAHMRQTLLTHPHHRPDNV